MGYDAPDPYETAGAQSYANREAAVTSTLMNNIDEKTPFGTSKYRTTGSYTGTDINGQKYEVPIRSRTVTLNPDERTKLRKANRLAIGGLDTANHMQRSVADTLKKPIDTDSMADRVTSVKPGEYRSGVGTPRLRDQLDMSGAADRQFSYAPKRGFSKDRQRVEEALMSRVSPQYERDRAALESQLVNQGFTRGSQAFNDAMDEMRRAETDARFQATVYGGDEQSRLLGEARAAAGFTNEARDAALQEQLATTGFGNATRQQNFANRMANAQLGNQAEKAAFQDSMQAGAFQNDVRNNQLQETLALRTQPLNEMGAAMSGGQVNIPQFQSMYRQGVEPAPIADSIYQSAQMEAQNRSAMMSGLFGLMSAPFSMFGFSDERMKENIKPIGETDGGTPLYSWNYKGEKETRIGPIAQEVAETQPEAVGVHSSGMLGVRYDLLK